MDSISRSVTCIHSLTRHIMAETKMTPPHAVRYSLWIRRRKTLIFFLAVVIKENVSSGFFTPWFWHNRQRHRLHLEIGELSLFLATVTPKHGEVVDWVAVLQVVDMRWGVRDEATDDHVTTGLCLQEIDTCQRLSVGPNFCVCRLLPSQTGSSDNDSCWCACRTHGHYQSCSST